MSTYMKGRFVELVAREGRGWGGGGLLKATQLIHSLDEQITNSRLSSKGKPQTADSHL